MSHDLVDVPHSPLILRFAATLVCGVALVGCGPTASEGAPAVVVNSPPAHHSATEREAEPSEFGSDDTEASERESRDTLPTTRVEPEVFGSTSSKPDGFEDVLTVYFGGDPFGCMTEPPVEDSLYFEGYGATTEIEIGYRVNVCLPGSVGDVSQQDWKIIDPNGDPARPPLSNEPAGWDWFPQPGDPPGEYRFTLPDYPQVGEAVLTLKLASRPNVFLFPPPDADVTALVHCHSDGAKGAVIGMVGHNRTNVHLYTQSAPATIGADVPFTYQTSFPVAIDPATGQGVFELDLEQSDAALNYGLTLSGAGESIFQNGGALLCQDGWP